MKRFILRNLTAVAVLLAVSASVFGFFAGVEGKYKGTANIDGMGVISVTAELKGADDKLTGVINSTQGDANITSGNVKDGKIMFQFVVGDMNATFNGTVDDKGKISGTITSDQINGTLELVRDEETPKTK